MGTEDSVSTTTKTLGIVLIVIVGLLNFHLPHFLLERPTSAGDEAYLEFVFLANLLGAVIAALAIWRNRRWGWLLGGLRRESFVCAVRGSRDSGTPWASQERVMRTYASQVRCSFIEATMQP